MPVNRGVNDSSKRGANDSSNCDTQDLRNPELALRPRVAYGSRSQRIAVAGGYFTGAISDCYETQSALKVVTET